MTNLGKFQVQVLMTLAVTGEARLAEIVKELTKRAGPVRSGNVQTTLMRLGMGRKLVQRAETVDGVKWALMPGSEDKIMDWVRWAAGECNYWLDLTEDKEVM